MKKIHFNDIGGFASMWNTIRYDTIQWHPLSTFCHCSTVAVTILVINLFCQFLEPPQVWTSLSLDIYIMYSYFSRDTTSWLLVNWNELTQSSALMSIITSVNLWKVLHLLEPMDFKICSPKSYLNLLIITTLLIIQVLSATGL